MTPTTLAKTILRDVRRYMKIGEEIFEDDDGAWLRQDEVLSALTAAMDPAIAERAGEVVAKLRMMPTYSGDPKTPYWVPDVAADMLTALIAQNAALRAERDEAHALASERSSALLAAEAQIATLTAQVERLTGALQAFKDFDDLPVLAKRPDVFELRVRQPILAALSTTTEEGHE